jgi:hypothetical protein
MPAARQRSLPLIAAAVRAMMGTFLMAVEEDALICRVAWKPSYREGQSQALGQHRQNHVLKGLEALTIVGIMQSMRTRA